MYLIHEGVASHRRGLSIEAFERRFIQLCEAHHAQGRAWAFAFIVYDERHPHVRRALGEDGYWDYLDQLSGNALTVLRSSIHHDHVPSVTIQTALRCSLLSEETPETILFLSTSATASMRHASYSFK